MGIKHHKSKEYIIEQYSENTAVILIKKPFVEGFIKKEFEKEIRAILKPFLGNSYLDNNVLIFTNVATKLVESRKHNDIRVEIYFKFKNGIKFKDKVHFLEQSIIHSLINYIKKEDY